MTDKVPLNTLLPTFHTGDKLHPLPVLVSRENIKELVQFGARIKSLHGYTPMVAVKGEGLFGYPADGI